MRKVKTKAWIAEVEVYDNLSGHSLAMQCQTADLKPFDVTLIFSPTAPERSTKGRNWSLIEKMLRGISIDEWEAEHFNAKLIAAKVRDTFHWFRLDVDGKNIWLRDVKPCDAFELHDEAAAIRAVEEAFNVS